MHGRTRASVLNQALDKRLSAATDDLDAVQCATEAANSLLSFGAFRLPQRSTEELALRRDILPMDAQVADFQIN